MADAPWRCSQCGTINEPVANACRTCGRWPSLFDLEAGKVEDVETEATREPAPPFEHEFGGEFERELELPDLPVEPVEDVAMEEEAEPEPPSMRWRRILRTVIVPLAVVIYLVISIVTNR